MRPTCGTLFLTGRTGAFTVYEEDTQMFNLSVTLGVVFCIAFAVAAAGQALAQSRIEIAGPDGEPVPGGRIVHSGAVFEITFIFDDGPGPALHPYAEIGGLL